MSQSNVNFSKALLLGIAYSASIGGLATLIGTPPNALLAAFLSETYGMEVGFAEWNDGRFAYLPRYAGDYLDLGSPSSALNWMRKTTQKHANSL